MRIRKATVGDAQAVLELHGRTVREVCGPDYSAEQIEAWLAGDSLVGVHRRIERGQVRVAVDESDRVLGFAARSGDCIHALYVAADHQGEGIGSALLAQLEADAREEGVAELTAHSTVTAAGFYAKHGYEVGQQVDCPVSRDIPVEAFGVRRRLL